MAISITKNNFGNFIDLFGGKADLNNKKIRVLHNLSFIDDPTRILRAIRFEKRYGFKIDAETLKALRVAVRLKMLEKVQPQRLRDELILTLKEAKPIKEIERIQQLAGFKFINPSLSPAQDT
jgi:tRNA nucleotidyltransferase (CCA-adding enzyme)